MEKTIKFHNGTEEVTLKVQNAFAYTYDATKTVLKLKIAEEDHSFAEISELKKCESTITYYEDGEAKADYEGYILGSKGFVNNYKEGVFDIELTQENSLSIRLDKIEGMLDFVLTLVGGAEEDEEEEG